MYNPIAASWAVLVLLLPSAAATSFKYNDDMTCDYPLSLNIEDMSCDGTATCHFGDELRVYGAMTIQEDLAFTSMCVTTKSCFMGVDFLCKKYMKSEMVNICEFMGVSSASDGTACPEAGSFYFEDSVQLPGQADYILGTGWWVSLTIDVTDCNPYSDYGFSCEGSWDAVSSKGIDSEQWDEWENMNVTGAVLFGIAAVAFAVARKRRTARINHAEEEGRAGVNGSFELMRDSGSLGVRA